MPEQSADQKKPEDNKGGEKPGVYFNGFNINNTLVDFQLQLSLNSNPIENYNMAPITAKNLAIQLASVVEKYEKLTGTHIDPFTELKERTQEKMKEGEETRKEQEKKDKEQKEKDEKEKEQKTENG